MTNAELEALSQIDDYMLPGETLATVDYKVLKQRILRSRKC
jgi:hypothetical protein